MKRAVDKGPSSQSHPELLPGVGLLIAGLVLFVLAWRDVRLSPSLVRLLYNLSALSLVTATGFLSAYITAKALERGVPERRDRKVFIRRRARPLSPILERARGVADKAYTEIANFDWRGRWLAISLTLALCALAFWALVKGWRLSTASSTILFDQISAGILIGLAFPILVLERKFAALSERILLEAESLSRLLRLPLLGILALGVASVLHWFNLPLVVAIEHGVALVVALVAAEFCLRSLVFFFIPLPPLEDRKSHTKSLVINLMRLQRPSFKAMSASVTRQFGIDLSRSWALGFIRRATVPMILGLAICGWLLTGVTAISMNERAVYEAFGRPQSIFHSGLHVYLPWPFGRLRPIEYGAVREIPIVFAAEDGAPPEVETTSASIGDPIEGLPPASADRLWDASHPSEASYLVASNRNGRENFEIVNIDLQIIYRFGLSDQAALRAAYRIDTPETLIRAAAGRMLAQYFARYTIPDVLGQNRERFIQGFQTELQSRLDELSSGIDILGVVIEAIHPPAAAATAYQDVQAAAIRSITAVSTARGEATRVLQQAESDALTMRDSATAEAAEMVNQAKVDTALFAGDVVAYRQDGASFLFERRLGALQQAFKPGIPVTIVDHRILSNQMPSMDLRPTGAPALPPLPPAADEEDDDR